MLKVVRMMTVALLLTTGLAVAQENSGAAKAVSPTTTSNSVSQPKAAMQKAPALKVVDAVIATGVENRTPVGASDTFSPTVGKLYCFTRIVGAKEPTEIKHVWFFDNKEVASIILSVKSMSWRTFSNKLVLPSMKGDWKVEVQSSDGSVLKTIDFKVE